MASTSEKPKKGILKHSGSVDHSKKEIEWDEMNILATYHPPDKDYGFMKVDEPPTPYNKASISDNEDEAALERKGSVSSVPELDPAQLAERLGENKPTEGEKHFYDNDSEESEENENETEEERKKRKAFLLKRKMHYNEFQAVQLAKKLMAEEDDEDDDDNKTALNTENKVGASGSASKAADKTASLENKNPCVNPASEESVASSSNK
ncbi:protein phosphatase inhibitor 2 [Plakobranchus ocellatus]|uniref:Protein phosphatase inhibitor 2 n=1 Tax=Plakobranchus ocellatus TaxID=259542 RepID=A0AAV4DBR8_9GAST|nr:protein phosphatase inhibitor 2 [Plakobranchus ocellatus]